MVFAPFLITFREVLEAALIIAIILAYLTKIERKDLHKYVWLGAGLATVLSVGIGTVLLLLFGALQGVNEKLFEGIASLLAAGVLTSMILWMSKNARNLKGSMQKKIDRLVSRKFLAGITLLAFIAVFREGIETVLFLTALFGQDFVGTFWGLLGGIVSVVIVAYFLLKGSLKLPLHSFFKWTSVLLIVFAAGLLGYGIHELLEAGDLLGLDAGLLGESAFDVNPPKESVFHEKGAVGSVAKALVGWDGNPEWLRVIAYIVYWILIGLYVRKSFKAEIQELIKS